MAYELCQGGEQLKVVTVFYAGFLVGPDERFITLDPAVSKPAISLYMMNYKKLDVQIYAVQPSDWSEYLTYLDEYQWTDEHKDPPGRLLLDETQDFDTTTDIYVIGHKHYNYLQKGIKDDEIEKLEAKINKKKRGTGSFF